jgi:hypothetical protein
MKMASLEIASPTRSGESDPTWGATFTWAPYTASTEPSRRNHCVFCWATFVEPGDPIPDARDEGYVTSTPISSVEDDSLWVCDSCFHEHKDEFAWQVARTNVH